MLPHTQPPPLFFKKHPFQSEHHSKFFKKQQLSYTAGMEEFRPWKDVADDCLRDGIGEAFFDCIGRACRPRSGGDRSFQPVDASVDWDHFILWDGEKRPAVRIVVRDADGRAHTLDKLIKPIPIG
jgi:hypothetical protein